MAVPEFRKVTAVSVIISPVLPASTLTQSDQHSRVLVIEGQTGQAPVIEKDGRAYVDVEALTQITHGSLNFKADRFVLSLPTRNVNPPMVQPQAEPARSPIADSGLSRDFMLAGIEEIATMREWASTLEYVIQNGYPITEHWRPIPGNKVRTI